MTTLAQMKRRSMAAMAVLGLLMVIVFILQIFFIGWYSGKNHERLEWSEKYIQIQGDNERERVRNEQLSLMVGP